MLKLIVLNIFILLKYNSTFLHLKNIISVSRGFLEAVNKNTEQLYYTGRNSGIFSHKIQGQAIVSGLATVDLLQF